MEATSDTILILTRLAATRLAGLTPDGGTRIEKQSGLTPYLHRRKFVGIRRMEKAAEDGAVVSWNVINEVLRQPVCVYVTDTDRHRLIDTFVTLNVGEGGVRKPSWILCHDIFTLEEARMDAFSLDEDGITRWKLLEVERKLATVLDLHLRVRMVQTPVQTPGTQSSPEQGCSIPTRPSRQARKRSRSRPGHSRC